MLNEYSLKEYGHLLIRATLMSHSIERARFYSSPIKKRIQMMRKKKNRHPWRIGQLITLLLLIGGLTVTCSDLMRVKTSQDETVFSLEELDEKPSLKIPSGTTPTENPDRFMLEQIYKNILYPIEARAAGTTGFFEANFTVDEYGKMQEVTVQPTDKALSKKETKIVIVGYRTTATQPKTLNAGTEPKQSLSAEIKRVLEALPDWHPAQRNGENIPFKMTLYFKYMLED